MVSGCTLEAQNGENVATELLPVVLCVMEMEGD